MKKNQIMAGKKLKNPKAKDLSEFVGLLVIIYVKNVMLSVQHSDGTLSEGNGLKGYVIAVTDSFLYLGADPEVYDAIIDILDVSMIRIPDEIDQVMSLLGQENSNGDLQ